MPLKIEDVNASILKQKFFQVASFQVSLMADDWVFLHKSSPNWEKGIEVCRRSGFSGYGIYSLTNIPVYDGFAYFIARIANGSGICGINIRHTANQKCFVPVNPTNWGGWGRASVSWLNTGCWAICSIGANSETNWKIKIPMV